MRIQRLSDEAIANHLGDALRERRLRKNLTQEELALRVGVSTPTLQKLEKGKGTLQLLIAVLREINSLDLLTALISPPRISPLEVAKTGKTIRRRAAGFRVFKSNVDMSKANADGKMVVKQDGAVILKIPRTERG